MRDIKVYENHAFIVSEHIGHGMQVFDLTRLRDVENSPATFTADAVYTGVSNTHDLGINEESGFAYLVGTDTCGNGEENGGLHMVDISEPHGAGGAATGLSAAFPLCAAGARRHGVLDPITPERAARAPDRAATVPIARPRLRGSASPSSFP